MTQATSGCEGDEGGSRRHGGSVTLMGVAFAADEPAAVTVPHLR